MLVIRLSRTGRTKRPHYRVVVAEKSAAVKGRYLEVLGHFDPRTKELKIDEERAKARLANGAEPSETAGMLLEKAGVLKRDKLKDEHRRPTRKKKKDIKAEAESADKPAAKPADDAAATDDKTDKEEKKPAAKDEPKKDDKPADQPEKKAEADKKADKKPEAKPEAKKEPKDNEKGDS